MVEEGGGIARVVYRETSCDSSHPREGIPVTIETKFDVEAYDRCPSLALYEDNDGQEGKGIAGADGRCIDLYRQEICKLRNCARALNAVARYAIRRVYICIGNE